jgi:hypothetical protein
MAAWLKAPVKKRSGLPRLVTRPHADGAARRCNHSDTTVSVNTLGYVAFKPRT